MGRAIDDGRRALNELHGLLEMEKQARWWERWAIRSAIIAKLRFRMSELFRAVESTGQHD